MKIAIEAQRIFRTNKHGMDFVALESIRELQKIDHENEYFIFVTPSEDRCLEESENVHIIELKCPTYPLWEQVALPRAVKKIMPIYCTASNTAPLQCPVPLILTLHDIIYLEKRHFFSFTWYQEMGWFYRRMVKYARVLAGKKIITVSQFERERILDVLHLPKEQLVAVYNGFNSHFHVQPKAPEITRKYIDADLFFLGNTDPKKNTPRVLKAYSDYPETILQLPLLIADLKEDVIDRILEEENITEIKVISRSGIHCEYRPCSTLLRCIRILLSIASREFRHPDAGGNGETPSFTGNTSAMPEIAGENFTGRSVQLQ